PPDGERILDLSYGTDAGNERARPRHQLEVAMRQDVSPSIGVAVAVHIGVQRAVEGHVSPIVDELIADIERGRCDLSSAWHGIAWTRHRNRRGPIIKKNTQRFARIGRRSQVAGKDHLTAIIQNTPEGEPVSAAAGSRIALMGDGEDL